MLWEKGIDLHFKKCRVVDINTSDLLRTYLLIILVYLIHFFLKVEGTLKELTGVKTKLDYDIQVYQNAVFLFHW